MARSKARRVVCRYHVKFIETGIVWAMAYDQGGQRFEAADFTGKEIVPTRERATKRVNMSYKPPSK